MESSHVRRPERVFVDSSALFAAAASASGFARDLIITGIRGDLDLAYCTLVLEETTRNLSRKRAIALSVLDELTAALPPPRPDPPRELVLEVAQIVEIKDAPIVASAMALEAAYLATYDRRHLLNQAELILRHFGIIVATPEEILRIIQQH